jgi:hypothetical protein
MSVPTAPAATGQTLTLALNRLSELFSAPEINPFSTKPVDLRGESGLAYLHRRARLRWLRSFSATQLTIQLPAAELPADGPAVAALAQATQAALARYCQAQVRHNEQTWRGERALLRRQLRVVLPVALVSFALLLVILTGVLLPDHPLLQGVLIVVTLFAASLALFDVLTGIFFGWTPYAMDNRAYRLLGNLRINIEVLP